MFNLEQIHPADRGRVQGGARGAKAKSAANRPTSQSRVATAESDLKAGLAVARRTCHQAAGRALSVAYRASVSGQLHTRAGRRSSPTIAGWELNADGSFNMVFGYMNRNYEEHLHMPIGREQ